MARWRDIYGDLEPGAGPRYWTGSRRREWVRSLPGTRRTLGLDTVGRVTQQNMLTQLTIQLGQLRLNPPRLGSKCGKRVDRLSDF